jgi:hypothetical protein
MVNVTPTAFCPYCGANQLDEEDRPKTGSDRCLNCFKIIKKPSSKYFESPDYIFHQQNTLIEELKKDKLNPEDLTYQTRSEAYRLEYELWFRNCLHEDRVAALSDALEVMRHLIYSRSTPEEFKQLVKLAKNVGEISHVVDQLIRAGVPTYDREIRQVRAYIEDAHGSSSSATASRDT